MKLGSSRSAGQILVWPSQSSAASQSPTAWRRDRLNSCDRVGWAGCRGAGASLQPCRRHPRLHGTPPCSPRKYRWGRSGPCHRTAPQRRRRPRRHGRWWLLRPRRQVPLAAAPIAVLQAWQSVVEPPPQAVQCSNTPSTQKSLGALGGCGAGVAVLLAQDESRRTRPSPPRCSPPQARCQDVTRRAQSSARDQRPTAARRRHVKTWPSDPGARHAPEQKAASSPRPRGAPTASMLPMSEGGWPNWFPATSVTPARVCRREVCAQVPAMPSKGIGRARCRVVIRSADDRRQALHPSRSSQSLHWPCDRWRSASLPASSHRAGLC